MLNLLIQKIFFSLTIFLRIPVQVFLVRCAFVYPNYICTPALLLGSSQRPLTPRMDKNKRVSLRKPRLRSTQIDRTLLKVTNVHAACEDCYTTDALLDEYELLESHRHDIWTDKTSRHVTLDPLAPGARDLYRERGMVLAPDEILQILKPSGLKIPLVNRGDGPVGAALPLSDLLRAIRYYAQDHARKGAFEETALLAMGMLTESWMDEIIDDASALMFLKPLDENLDKFDPEDPIPDPIYTEEEVTGSKKDSYRLIPTFEVLESDTASEVEDARAAKRQKRTTKASRKAEHSTLSDSYSESSVGLLDEGSSGSLTSPNSPVRDAVSLRVNKNTKSTEHSQNLSSSSSSDDSSDTSAEGDLSELDHAPDSKTETPLSKPSPDQVSEDSEDFDSAKMTQYVSVDKHIAESERVQLKVEDSENFGRRLDSTAKCIVSVPHDESNDEDSPRLTIANLSEEPLLHDMPAETLGQHDIRQAEDLLSQMLEEELFALQPAKESESFGHQNIGERARSATGDSWSDDPVEDLLDEERGSPMSRKPDEDSRMDSYFDSFYSAASS